MFNLALFDVVAYTDGCAYELQWPPPGWSLPFERRGPMEQRVEGTPNVVLLVDDDLDLQRSLTEYLTVRGIEVTAVDRLAEAQDLLRRHRFSAVLLDLQPGSDDGLRLARQIRGEGGPPVIIISTRSDEADRIIGFEAGADDYVVKPFSFAELLARLRVVSARASAVPSPPPPRLARFANWTFDPTSHELRNVGGQVTALTTGQSELLRAFLDHPQRVLSRVDLLALTGHRNSEVFDRTIDVLVARLRRTLERHATRPQLIETIRNRGYRFNAKVTWISVAMADME